MLGVGVRSVRLSSALAARVGQERALEVVELLADGPAAKAGCAVGDLLLKLGGVPIVDAQSLRAALEQHLTGARVALDLLRNNTLQTYTVELQGIPKLGQAT